MRFSKAYYDTLTPDDYLDKSNISFIISGGKLYVGPGNEQHGALAKRYGVPYGRGSDVSGRISKSENNCFVWDYSGITNPYDPIFEKAFRALYGQGLLNNTSTVYIHGSNVRGMNFLSYLRMCQKLQEQKEQQSVSTGLTSEEEEERGLKKPWEAYSAKPRLWYYSI